MSQTKFSVEIDDHRIPHHEVSKILKAHNYRSSILNKLVRDSSAQLPDSMLLFPFELRYADIVQIAESGDIDHHATAAAEPSRTDASDLAVPLQPSPLTSLRPPP
uniref:Uncharacterized protein n=1 Tax=Vespula pensylvanica TaxID=30213 RepID=A0A834U3Y7_VESPE|nr:hypothetical protein H0235_012164 [Vespula pensylvanica]